MPDRLSSSGTAGGTSMDETSVRQSRSYQNAMTGNAALNYAAWQLSRRGWHVMPTVRNARGSDLIVTDANETVFFGVQSKGLSKRAAVPLGREIDQLRSDWWVITVRANSDKPTCYVLRNAEVRTLASRDANGGACWLEPRAYDRDEFREAWGRISELETERAASE